MIYSLLIVLLVLLLDRQFADRAGLNPFSWFDDWAMSVEQRFNGGEASQGAAALALTVGSVFLVVLLMQTVLSQMNWLFRIGFDLFCMYFFVQLHSKLSLASKVSAALAASEREVAEKALADLPVSMEEILPDDDASRQCTARLLVGMNSWFFGPVFWYLVFGPAGAALYFTASIVAQAWNWKQARYQEFGRAANRLYQLLSWVPVRLLAAGYALLGDFESAFRSWRAQSDTWTGSNNQLLITVGLGALREDAEGSALSAETIDLTIALIYRVVIFWVVLGIVMGVLSFVV